MSNALGLFFDGLITILLCLMIFYAMKLSVLLRVFRDSRNEFGKLLDDLSRNIQKAEGAIAGLKDAVRKSGGALDDVMLDSRRMADELRLMNEAGDNLANRLESLAERGREASAGRSPMNGLYEAARELEEQAAARREQAMPKTRAPSKPPARSEGAFAIQDRDFDEDEELEADEDDGFEDDHDDMPESAEAGTMLSKAERDLYEALQKTKSRGKSGRGGLA